MESYDDEIKIDYINDVKLQIYNKTFPFSLFNDYYNNNIHPLKYSWNYYMTVKIITGLINVILTEKSVIKPFVIDGNKNWARVVDVESTEAGGASGAGAASATSDEPMIKPKETLAQKIARRKAAAEAVAEAEKAEAVAAAAEEEAKRAAEADAKRAAEATRAAADAKRAAAEAVKRSPKMIGRKSKVTAL